LKGVDPDKRASTVTVDVSAVTAPAALCEVATINEAPTIIMATENTEIPPILIGLTLPEKRLPNLILLIRWLHPSLYRPMQAIVESVTNLNIVGVSLARLEARSQVIPLCNTFF